MIEEFADTEEIAADIEGFAAEEADYEENYDLEIAADIEGFAADIEGFAAEAADAAFAGVPIAEEADAAFTGVPAP